MKNQLYCADNIDVMRALLDNDEYRERIQMIYVDPPFFSGKNYDAVVWKGKEKEKVAAYEDRWERGLEGYLDELSERLMLMKKLLSKDGLIFIHLDWHVVHHVRIIMDRIFGAGNFVNEIIWTYKSGGSTKRRFARKHDNILVYCKTSKYKFNPLKEKSYNRGLKPYRFKGVEEFEDEVGWYTMVNMKDVWALDMVGRTSSERTGYATQKPEKLIARIVECSTDPGDLCADFFCGSGTLPVVAGKLGRRFIAADAGKVAIECTASRLDRAGIEYELDDGGK